MIQLINILDVIPYKHPHPDNLQGIKPGQTAVQRRHQVNKGPPICPVSSSSSSSTFHFRIPCDYHTGTHFPQYQQIEKGKNVHSTYTGPHSSHR